MKKQHYQTLKGFRDFLPAEKNKRDYVARKLRETFALYGFQPLETPTLEYADLLTGKYGEEADKLVYTFEDKGLRQVGLRYDQTVPTARVLGQYQNELPKFFRRYQIQNVFRADKPQKGRYREFTQCDIDIFGVRTGLADAEILACTYQAFADLGFPKIELRVNDRQTLISTLAPFITETVSVFSLIQSVDKLDKLAPEAVVAELMAKGLETTAAQQALLAITTTKPSTELQAIIKSAVALGVPKSAIIVSPTLARGLDYYTGMIFEVIIPEYSVGSCGGGGRYDELINQLSGTDVPAVGMAFGFDRVVEAAEQLGLIPENTGSTQVLITNLGSMSIAQSLNTACELRNSGISVEIYPKEDKLSKQLKLADQKNIPWVVIIGEEEVQNGQVTLKNMVSGEQERVPIDILIGTVFSNSFSQ